MSEAQCAIIGVGSSSIERKSTRSITAFALDAAIEAIRDAGLNVEDIDGYVGGPTSTTAGAPHADGADELSMRLLTERLGLKRLAWAADLSGDFTTSMITAATHAIAAGTCSAVLVLRAMHNLGGVPDAFVPRTKALGADQFESPFGFRTGGARFALRAQSYMARSGATRRDLYEVVALSRENAARNPLAVQRCKTVSLDEYLEARMIAEPHCLYDCDMPVCGAAAFIVTSSANSEGTRNPPVYIRGSAGWQRPDDIFERANVNSDAIRSCQLYDGFSTMMYEWLERFGWAKENEGWRFFRDGHAAFNGKMPINSFGGSLGEGRLHGAGHVREAVLQMSGRAAERQHENAENCLVQIGPFDFSSLMVLSRSPK